MHFVYKLDRLIQSTRVSHENSSVTKTFHFSKLISTQHFFCIQHATFKATYWNFNHLWLHLVFFMPLMIYFQLYDLEIAKGHNLNSEKVGTWHGIIITKTFHFSKLVSTQDIFCIQLAIFKATYWNFSPFWLHLIFFMHFTIYFQLNDLEIGKGYNLNSEKVETWHGVIIWPTFHFSKPHTEISTLSDFFRYFSCI